MPGPPPKNEGMRQRRNKSSSRAQLPAESRPLPDKPRLPNCPNAGGWNSMAQRWWEDVWSSPMASQFSWGDMPALFRLVALVDAFWKSGELEFAREIRLLEREFGLTPLSRRRLEWSVAQAEEATDRLDRRRERQAKTIDVQAGDPRGVLS